MSIFNKRNKKLEEIENEKDSKNICVASRILSDGTIIEMVFDREDNSTALVVWKDGEFSIKKSYSIGDQKMIPYKSDKDFLQNDVVLFPSKPKEFGTQTDLIIEVQNFIHKYLSVSDFFERICSYYVLFSWIYDDFNELPYLRCLGDYGTGKSRFLKAVGSICYHPIFTSGATTTSPIFRMLNDFRGTLILDEADFKLSDTTAEIIKILNSGFAKGNPVLRCESSNKNFDVKTFNVFSPKLIATRRLFDDSALESRMITEDMNLNLPRKDIQINITDDFEEEALELRNKLLRFRFLMKGKSSLNTDYEDRSIEPRLNQIAVPLMSIIDDENVVKEIQGYIKEYNNKIKTDRTLSYNYQIIEAICELKNNGCEKLTIGNIANVFNKDLGDKEQVTSRKMGYLVKKILDLKTEKTRDGYVLSEENNSKIEVLAKRYGIELKSEYVNDVNVVIDEVKNEGLNGKPLF